MERSRRLSPFSLFNQSRKNVCTTLTLAALRPRVPGISVTLTPFHLPIRPTGSSLAVPVTEFA